MAVSVNCGVDGEIRRSTERGCDDPGNPPLFGGVGLEVGIFLGCGGAMIRMGSSECFVYFSQYFTS
jgi:hypothetical protein